MLCVSFLQVGCGNKTEYVVLKEGASRGEALKQNIYAPFRLRALWSDDPKVQHGNRENFLEFGNDGYNSISFEHSNEQKRLFVSKDVFTEPGKPTEYVNIIRIEPKGELLVLDVVQGRHLPGVIPRGKWVLCIYPIDDDWHLSLTMDGGVIKSIEDRESNMGVYRGGAR